MKPAASALALMAALAMFRPAEAHAGPDAKPAPAKSGPAQPAPTDRLPEDPALGAKSTAQWREHLVAEERERQLHYDRDRLKDHRAVVRLIVAARARVDRAASKAAVTAVRGRMPQDIAAVRARIAKIDHWGTNSKLLADYDALLVALGESYPAARASALEGDRAPLAAARADFDRRLKVIKAWLAEAAASEGE